MSRATFEEFENEFPEYFAQLDNKMIQAHEVAFRILGNSYQLEFTIDYQKWIKNQKQNENENQNQKQNQPADNNSTENK
jgi:mRNA-degrading endonuclease HigB of HigAB toxin-antitoxin module